jgi:hypothetical protein
LHGLTWSGRWVVLAQGDSSIFDAASTALIPFDPGWISLPRRHRPDQVLVVTATDTTPHKTWQWHNGLLRIDVADALVASAALGFLIQD